MAKPKERSAGRTFYVVFFRVAAIVCSCRVVGGYATFLSLMKTKFVDMELELAGGHSVYMDGNSKVTLTGDFDEPTPNCFSLVSIEDCPGSTPACEAACYTAGLAAFNPQLFEKYRHNSKVMRDFLKNTGTAENPQYLYWGRFSYFRVVDAFAAHIREHAPQGFRWHVSGDVFSLAYAHFIADVARSVPEIRFWIYTRSFAFVGALLGVANLTVNLSGDVDNEAACRSVHEDTGLRVCWMSTDGSVPAWLATDSVIFPDYSLRGRDLVEPTTAPWWGTLSSTQKKQVCPPDFFGQSQNLRCGPCTKCIDQPSSLVTLKGLTS